MHPSMIEFARDARGTTQKDLAEAIGLTQGALSKIENGQIVASADVLARIAAHLSFPPSFFEQAVMVNDLPPSFFRRRLTGISQKTIKTARAWWSLLLRGLSKLWSAVELPEYRVPSIDLATLGIDAADAAQQTRIQWRLPRSPIANVTALVEQQGVMVVPFDFGTNRIDGMSFYDRSFDLPPIVLVNKSIPGDRQRFTILHELGHLVMHSHLPSGIDDRDIEHEADLFASEMLLPSSAVKGHLVSLNLATLLGLKLHWKASMAALIMKADSMNMLSESHKRRLFTQLSIRGWKTVEPNPLPCEEPTLLRQLLALHQEQLGYSEAELRTIVGHLGERDFPALYAIEKPTGLRLVRK
jgi:Zn-dependent peptidase ImmA (M78 family)/transcriptional regulator with XRE-family HTH domain